MSGDFGTTHNEGNQFMSKRLPRRRVAIKRIGIPIAVLAVVTLGLVGAASANVPGSTFEGNDGNLVVNTPGNTDWANVAGLNTGIDVPPGSTDNAFGQGSKEDNPAVTVVDGSIPPNKNDLTRFYEASELASNNHNYLYLGWERLVNIGNANLDFEINQKTTTGFTAATIGPVTLNRTAGDLLVTYDFGGSGTPTLGLNFWLTAAAGNTAAQCFSSNSLPCWGKHVDLGTNAEGAVNAGTVIDPLQTPTATLTAGLFGEAAIDLTAAGVFPPGTCEAFGSAFVKSRSASSFGAELKDFIAPIGVNISNCGTIAIHKVTENGDSSFGYTTTGGLTPSTFSLSNGGTRTYTAVPAGSSSVTENLTPSQVTAGWTLKSLVCTNQHGSSTSVSGATVNITMVAGGEVDCTYTNHINVSPTIATTLSKTTANIGDAVHDSATLSGATANAGGTVTYSAYVGANTCTGTDLLNSTVNVTGGVVPDSADFTPTAAGTYSFQAVYSGDANNNGATSVCSTEQLLVKTNPTITTTLSATSVDVGSTVHDSATLHDATSDAGGTVTYTVYTNNTCTAGARDAGTVNVTNGAVPDSNALAFNTAGTFYWQAVYSGDAKNSGATSTCTDETLVVNPRQPTVSTAQNLIPNDNFTLSGGFNPTGTITFNLYDPSDATCSGTPALTQTVNVNGNGTYSTTNTTFTASTEGTWRWASSYSGDNNNQTATSSCGTERFTIANS
jgi:hypothetical protein